MSSSTTPVDVGILVSQGGKLKSLLREASTRSVEGSADRPENVKNVVTSLLSSFKNIPKNVFFAKESLDNVLKELQVTLEEFIQYEPEFKSVYEYLIKEISDFRCQRQVSTVGSSAGSGSGSGSSSGSGTDSSNINSVPNIGHSDELDFDDSALKELPVQHKQCICCFLLFPAEFEIKKREIVHCWIGIGMDDLQAVEFLLAKFVANGLVDHVTLNKKLISKYKMPRSVHTYLLHHSTIPSTEIKDKDNGSWSILYKQKPLSDSEPKKTSFLRRMGTLIQSPNSDDMEDPEVLLNFNQTALNAKRFKTMSGMHSLKAVHLGSWGQDSKKYIVVEDIDDFKYLKFVSSDVRFLSLEGVSGIVNLPKSVCKLYKLKVLDLRACNNLELLPTDIGDLKYLTHLDLSQCYLLNHLPWEVTKLINLQVLKGFVINTEQHEKMIKGKGKGKPSGTTTSTFFPFEELSKLKQLSKLTIITRRMGFPTTQNFATFCGLAKLKCLRITWVGNSTTEDLIDGDDDGVRGTFPAALTKLELEAAPNHTASRLLRLISNDTDNSRLEKLYIRGGGLQHITYVFHRPRIVRLRYLHQLQIEWENFSKLFPNLIRLEVLGCPNLILFPCDKYGIWGKTTRHSDTLW